MTETTITATLTAAHSKQLRRPFTAEAVKWRADSKKPDASGNVRCVLYIDSRLAIERLSDVDPCWSQVYKAIGADSGDPLGVRHFAPLLCGLTVRGVTRFDVGQLGEPKMDGKYAKSVFSDALKRAAVQFGIGAYLYAMPVFKVPASQCWIKGTGDNQTVGALNKEAITNLRGQYLKVVTHAKFIERHGTPIDYGDIEDDERSTGPVDDLDGVEFGTPAATPQTGGRAVPRAES